MTPQKISLMFARLISFVTERFLQELNMVTVMFYHDLLRNKKKPAVTISKATILILNWV